MQSEPQLGQSLGSGMIDLKGGSEKRQLTNFTGEGMDRWHFLSKVTNQECTPASKSKGQILRVVYWFVQEVDCLNDRTQKLERAIRTVLVDDHGEAYDFVSEGIYSCLRTMVAEMGMGPYDPPLEVIPREGESKRNRRYYWLEPVPREVA